MFALPLLPNIQPMTATLIIIALNIGVIDSLVVSVLSLLVTNMILGMGPWTINQIISFTVIILLTMLIKSFYKPENLKSLYVFSIWTFFLGFLYGLIISYLDYKLYGMANFFVYYLNGIYFDSLHAIGNLGFFIILEPIIVPIINKRFNETIK